ncbi:MAG TPA: phosphotransferase [Aggregatilineales bacterium]|nr:phosphotransferase [Aggregatilineales bacterium]
MAEHLLARLKAIDPAVLTDVVRQDQHCPAFEIAEWSIRRLSDKGVVNPDGLWLVNGLGEVDGTTRPWSVAVKIIQRPNAETPPDARNYWKRELLFAQSGLLDRLSGPARVPRVYRAEESNDCVWLWMEHVQDERSGAWTLDDYIFAARQLGRWNGACAARPLPTEPWLVKQPHRAWLGVVNPENDWQSPLHRKYISESIRLRFEQLWAESELFYGILEGLPQCFAHFDCNRRNLLIRRGADGQDELVIIDWALCTNDALGIELQALVGGSTMFVEWPSSDLAILDKATFKSYVQGLRETGWSGDVDAVRLAYVACLAIYRGAILPQVMANWFCAPESRDFELQQFGIAGEDLYVQWLPMLYYWLDCADEARVLMKKLKLF